MKMHVLSGGRLSMRKATYYPDAERGEMFELPVSCILLRHTHGNVLFDTGCHPSVAEDPEIRLGKIAKYMIPIMSSDDHVLNGLKAIGLTVDDIDIVVCSHLHTDHCGCNAFFKKATIIVPTRELAAAKAPDSLSRGYIAEDWDHPIPMRIIDGEHDVLGDGRIRLLPLPGHSPGMTGALVQLDRSGEFLLASDAVSVRANLDQNTAPKNTWNIDAFLRSMEEIRRIESAGATVICGHDDAQWQTLRKGVDFYD